jgi:hypothetical protein
LLKIGLQGLGGAELTGALEEDVDPCSCQETPLGSGALL